MRPFLLVAALSVLLAGCGAAGTPADGTVTGTVTISPCSPVERVGGTPCPPRPGLVVSFQPVGGGAARTTTTDQAGIYWIDLPAGEYDARAAGGIGPGPARRVSVTAGVTVTLNFDVDSGIR